MCASTLPLAASAACCQSRRVCNCVQVELIGLVAMMIAGCPAYRSPTSDMWLALTADLCDSLVPHPYLHALCWHLRNKLKGPSAEETVARSRSGSSSYGATPTSVLEHPVLCNNSLDLSDRVAFACKHLPMDQVLAFVTHTADVAEAQSRLNGLFLIGLRKRGVGVLQAYLDRTGESLLFYSFDICMVSNLRCFAGDVQTVALMSCYVHGGTVSGLSAAESRAVARWVTWCVCLQFWFSCFRR